MICECMSDFLFFFILVTQFNVDLQGGLSVILLTLKGLHNVTNKLLFFLNKRRGFITLTESYMLWKKIYC